MAAAGDRLPTSARIVSIGPITSEAAREAGLEVAVEASRHDIEGLIEALVADSAKTAMTLPITFLSDYGWADEFAGVCRAVMARIAPEATIIDLTHGIPRHDVRVGARTLAAAIAYAPAGVHLAVVDPGVGSPRRALAARAGDGRLFVGPDNGLLWLALERSDGIAELVDVSLSPHRLEPVHATFHGRDVFAPIAAHLANGVALAELGEPLDPDQMVRLEASVARLEEGRAIASVVAIDGFGNLALDLSEREAGSVRPEARARVARGGRGRGSRPPSTPILSPTSRRAS